MVKNEPTSVQPWIKNQSAPAARLCTHWPQTSPHLKWTFQFRELRSKENTHFSSKCFYQMDADQMEDGCSSWKLLLKFVWWCKVCLWSPCQHRWRLDETCGVLVSFKKLFVLHATTSPKICPSARRRNGLNPQPGHLTAGVLASEVSLTISRVIPAPTSSS